MGKIFAENRRARFDYEIKEIYDGGLSLSGHEAKSVRLGMANISGSRAIMRGGEVFLVGMNIRPFQPKNAPAGYEDGRVRKVLMKKDEISHLFGKTKEGLFLIPLEIYSDRDLLKVKLGLVRAKKKHDKRETEKKKEIKREIGKIFGKS